MKAAMDMTIEQADLFAAMLAVMIANAKRDGDKTITITVTKPE